jgi:DNA repair exonuclease SbcCD nuclease subunit
MRKIADLVLVSDLHLTDSTPVSRIDDYQAAQIKKLKFLQELSEENNNCPVLCAGDVFDYWKASPWLCSMAYEYLPKKFICIPGQHDLPGHSLQEYERSALGLLEKANRIKVLKGDGLWFGSMFIVGAPFGGLKSVHLSSTYDQDRPRQHRRVIFMFHELVWPDTPPSWDKRGNVFTSDSVLDDFGQYFPLILTGDNHQSFVREKNGSILVNPGSMMRINADQEDHKPKCYLYYAENNTVEAVDFPIEQDVHNREHLDSKKERDDRISAYIERMSRDWEIGLSFKKNLEVFFTENHVPQKVREIIWQAMEKTN